MALISFDTSYGHSSETTAPNNRAPWLENERTLDQMSLQHDGHERRDPYRNLAILGLTSHSGSDPGADGIRDPRAPIARI